MSNNLDDNNINATFPFAKVQFETATVPAIQELLLLPDASLGMLLLPVLPCGTQELMYCSELPAFELSKPTCGPGVWSLHFQVDKRALKEEQQWKNVCIIVEWKISKVYAAAPSYKYHFRKTHKGLKSILV